MGRPSRKTIASTIIFEEPNGDVLLFEIDKKGKSHLIGSNQIQTKSYLSNVSINPKITNLVQPNELLSEKLDQQHELPNENINFHKKKQKSYDLSKQMEKFDLFLEKIDSHLNFDDFFKEFKLSNNMLLPIDA